ncbi:MAG TPA: type 2 lanthipeptide synthetase LanM family protein [Vicinamibacterales bacterium]|nr:type 2 lanthipeptide synthetase LanM family protein [Vicinamibacterales bacterium]
MEPLSELTHLTGDERRQIATGAASVFERTAFALAGKGSRTEAFAPTEQALGVLRAWIQAFSPGDPEAFERRLGWDDLSMTDVARALSQPPVAIVEPDWLVHIDAIAGAARQAAADLDAGPLDERRLYAGAGTAAATAAPADSPDAVRDAELPPFFDLLVPMLRVARRALAAEHPPAIFAPDAVARLERHLLRTLARTAELAVFDELKAFRAADSGGYDAFVRHQLAEGLVPLFCAYPVLARQVAVIIGRWVSATAELASRIVIDREALAATFGDGTETGLVVDIEPALSDAHHGGRRVAALTFASGLRVVYKPRSLALDAAYGRLLAWVAAQAPAGDAARPEVTRGFAALALRVLDCGDHGWVEFVEQEACTSLADVRAYFALAGGLVCLTHVLRGSDLHMENVIATRRGPVLIDLEMLLQPVAKIAASSGPALPSGEAVAPGGTAATSPIADGESCLTTGFVTMVESNGGEVFDVGGLRGTGAGTAALAGRIWRDLDSDAIHFTDDATFTTRVRNAVRLEGAIQAPDAFAADLLEGFDATYRLLLAHREALLAADGPLAAFAGTPVRVLPRPTTQYASLIYLLSRPRYQKDGCRWSTAFDALNRAVNGSHDAPEVWPVLVSERKALEGHDVPHFTVLADDTAVRVGRRVLIEHRYARSGLAATKDRIAALSPADLHAQLARISRALSETIHSRYATEPEHAAHTELDVTSPDFLVDHALWIARELLDRGLNTPHGIGYAGWALMDEAGPRRHHLYDGSLGPAVFLAAAAVVSGEDRWRRCARDFASGASLAVSKGVVDDDAIGVGSGAASVVYGLTIIGALLGDGASLELARSAARQIAPHRIARDTALDVISGAAGAVLGLLALYKVTHDADVLDLATASGDRLVQTATAGDQGLSWRAPDGRVYTGFAHGVAGIAYALGRLFDVTGERRFGRASSDGYRYVASRYVDTAQNWPVLGEPVEGVAGLGPSMTAWCHGAPGVTLAISLGSADTVDAKLLDQLEPSLKTTAGASPHMADHLCCGNMGRCESLFTTGRRLMRREAVEGSRRLARVVIARARKAGHFCLAANGFEYRIFDPGFFRGVSGIGYTLLRLAAPSSLPSIAAFEAPPSSVRPTRSPLV